MNTYDLIMGPLEKKALYSMREQYIKQASGKVLEVGAGTGVNIGFYNKVDLTVSDRSISDILRDKLSDSQLNYDIRVCDVMNLPFEDDTFDTLVSTLVFCSVEDVSKGLMELKRVLKANGRLIFLEHVLPHEEPSRTLFNVLTPIWKRLASNCHLNRDYMKALKDNGFKIEDHHYRAGSKFVAGIAIIK